jgi:hypothetical protein
MEAITIFTDNAEQGRIVKAFLKALKISFVPTPTHKLEALEAQLTPNQLAWWHELKATITAVNKGETEGSIDAFDFLKELKQEEIAL